MQEKSQNNIDKLEDFVGNEQATKALRALVLDTRENKAAFPHLGIFGPSGYGKSALSYVVAKELDRNFVYINSTAVRKPDVIRTQIIDEENLIKGAVIFLDECHQLPNIVQDNLLSALERPSVLVTSYKGQVIRDKIPSHISFILATTDKSLIANTLLSRLEEIELGEYSVAEREAIAVQCLIKQHKLSPAQIEVDAVLEIGRRCRSGRHVVRMCNGVVRHLRLNKLDKVTVAVVDAECAAKGLNTNGLTTIDMKLLKYLHMAGHCGVDNLEAYLNIPKGQIQSTIEPWLIRNNLIVRQSSGRVITERGFDALQGLRIEYK